MLIRSQANFLGSGRHAGGKLQFWFVVASKILFWYLAKPKYRQKRSYFFFEGLHKNRPKSFSSLSNLLQLDFLRFLWSPKAGNPIGPQGGPGAGADFVLKRCTERNRGKHKHAAQLFLMRCGCPWPSPGYLGGRGGLFVKKIEKFRNRLSS